MLLIPQQVLWAWEMGSGSGSGLPGGMGARDNTLVALVAGSNIDLAGPPKGVSSIWHLYPVG